MTGPYPDPHWADPLRQPANSQGGGGIIVPTPMGRVGKIDWRVQNLERRTTVQRNQPAREAIVYTWQTLVVETGPPKRTLISSLFGEVEVLLATAGSTSTVVQVYKNGASIKTITLAASAVAGTEHIGLSWQPRADLLRVGVTTIGTGAAGLSVTGYFL